jgi:hypothetical protein
MPTYRYNLGDWIADQLFYWLLDRWRGYDWRGLHRRTDEP